MLEALRDERARACSSTCARATQRRCVVSLQSPHGLRWIVPEGALLPLDRGSAGRVLLAATPGNCRTGSRASRSASRASPRSAPGAPADWRRARRRQRVGPRRAADPRRRAAVRRAGSRRGRRCGRRAALSEPPWLPLGRVLGHTWSHESRHRTFAGPVAHRHRHHLAARRLGLERRLDATTAGGSTTARLYGLTVATRSCCCRRRPAQRGSACSTGGTAYDVRRRAGRRPRGELRRPRPAHPRLAGTVRLRRAARARAVIRHASGCGSSPSSLLDPTPIPGLATVLRCRTDAAVQVIAEGDGSDGGRAASSAPPRRSLSGSIVRRA